MSNIIVEDNDKNTYRIVLVKGEPNPQWQPCMFKKEGQPIDPVPLGRTRPYFLMENANQCLLERTQANGWCIIGWE